MSTTGTQWQYLAWYPDHRGIMRPHEWVSCSEADAKLRAKYGIKIRVV